MNSEDAVNPLVGNIFSRLDEQDHRMDQFAMALQTLPSRTAHLESPTVAALVQTVLQAVRAPVSVQAPTSNITSIRVPPLSPSPLMPLGTESVSEDKPMHLGFTRFSADERTLRRRERLCLYYLFSWAESSVEIQALIDPGAAGLFIDAAFVSKHSILLQLRDTPFAIEALDGRPLQPA
ncbi:hypothetical protein AB205_0157910, partial [Aquarana catesbeiana]